MILKAIELYNFMIFCGKHLFNLSKDVNLIVGKNESGKSILSIDAFKYVFLKRIRYKKIENLINNRMDKDDHGYASILAEIDGIEMGFKRFLAHPKYKNNLCLACDNSSVMINGNASDSFANVKNVPIQNFLKNMNVDLDFFDLVSIYNPAKDIINEKKSILDLLSVNFNSITSMFETIYRAFDNEVGFIQSDVEGLEQQLSELTKSRIMTDEADRINTENKKIRSRITEFKDRKTELNDALEKLNGYAGECSTKISESTKEVEKLARFYKSGICNTCGRPFDTEEQRDQLRKQAVTLRTAMSECDDKLKKINARIRQIRETINTIDSNIWKLADRGKDNEKKLVNNDAKIETLKNLMRQKRIALHEIEERILGFKRRYELVFSQESINAYIKSQIRSFEESYQEIYNVITNQSVKVALNLNRYEEPELGDFLYSGLSTSKKRIAYLVMMLALHSFIDTKLNFMILDEFFDVFDFENMVKILETIFTNAHFKDLQFIITSNNDDLIGLVKNNTGINLINLIDYTKN